MVSYVNFGRRQRFVLYPCADLRVVRACVRLLRARRYIGMWADAFPTNDGDAYATMEQVRFFGSGLGFGSLSLLRVNAPDKTIEFEFV